MITKLTLWNINVKRACGWPCPFVAFTRAPAFFPIRKSEFNERRGKVALTKETIMATGGRHDSLRRSALRRLGFLALVGGLGALFGAAPARARTSQAAAAYRNAPNGRQRCANCSWFEPPSGCGVVKGPVSARGWCNLWG